MVEVVVGVACGAALKFAAAEVEAATGKTIAQNCKALLYGIADHLSKATKQAARGCAE